MPNKKVEEFLDKLNYLEDEIFSELSEEELQEFCDSAGWDYEEFVAAQTA